MRVDGTVSPDGVVALVPDVAGPRRASRSRQRCEVSAAAASTARCAVSDHRRCAVARVERADARRDRPVHGVHVCRGESQPALEGPLLDLDALHAGSGTITSDRHTAPSRSSTAPGTTR